MFVQDLTPSPRWKLTLNTDFYGTHRDAVRRKLGLQADTYIDGLVLA